MDEENIVMEVTKQDVRGPRRDTDVTCWDFARRCVDLILSCTFMVVAFLQPCDKTNWKSFETVSLFHQTMGYWKFVVWLSSNSKVNLEAGKDKELFYKKTRLAWATWPARVGRLNTTTSTELEIPLFNKPVHMLFVWGPFRPQLFACFFSPCFLLLQFLRGILVIWVQGSTIPFSSLLNVPINGDMWTKSTSRLVFHRRFHHKIRWSWRRCDDCDDNLNPAWL